MNLLLDSGRWLEVNFSLFILLSKLKTHLKPWCLKGRLGWLPMSISKWKTKIVLKSSNRDIFGNVHDNVRKVKVELQVSNWYCYLKCSYILGKWKSRAWSWLALSRAFLFEEVFQKEKFMIQWFANGDRKYQVFFFFFAVWWNSSIRDENKFLTFWWDFDAHILDYFSSLYACRSYLR